MECVIGMFFWQYELHHIIFDKLFPVLHISTTLNSKHKKTLKAIFYNPVKSDIPWKEIEKMFIAMGAEVSEGSGSRIRIFLNHRIAIFHRPHPEKVTDKGAVKSVREYIINCDIDIEELL